MSGVDPQSDQRTELIFKLERPSAPPEPTPAVAEPRTALFRNPDLIPDAGDVETLQMSALLGGALSAQRALPPPPVRKRTRFRLRLWLGRLLVATVLGTFAMAIIALALTGVAERARQDSKDQARLLQELLLQGSLSEAEQHLGRLEALLAEARRPTAFSHLRARTEATLYRFHDADPKRRKRALELLSGGSERDSSDAWMAKTLLASRKERAALLEDRAALALARDAYPVALVASLLAHRGDLEDARATYAQAETLEPSHIIHLYAAFLLEHESEERRAAQLVLERMEDVSPKSPWTRLAAAQSEPQRAERTTALTALAEDDAAPSVVRALATESLLSGSRPDLEPEQAARLSLLRSGLTHGDDDFMAELPLPPRTHRGPAPIVDEAPIVTREISIEVPPAEKVAPKKLRKKRRRAKRAR